MTHSVKTLQINPLDQIAKAAPQHVLSAIQTASARSGVDFSYLVQQASVESSFDPAAKAKSSSATGLYQFIDSTWLDMIERHGADYGLDTAGKSDKELLAMRADPKAASFMAAAFASENEKSLNENWGGKVGATELYFAHFMGAGGAASFLKARDENPLQTAADLFPRAALANRNVFYDPQSGRPRTLEQVYQFFDKKFQDTPEHQAPIAVAALPPAPENIRRAPSLALSDSPVMQRAAQMRRESQSNSLFVDTTRTRRTEDKSPFYSLIARPADMMLLTQTVTPSKVIRDKI